MASNQEKRQKQKHDFQDMRNEQQKHLLQKQYETSISKCTDIHQIADQFLPGMLSPIEISLSLNHLIKKNNEILLQNKCPYCKKQTGENFMYDNKQAEIALD